MSTHWRDTFQEFWRSYTSKAGVILLIILVGISFYTVFTYPLNYGTRFWSNPSYWADNPKVVAPEWTDLFTSKKLLKHTVLTTSMLSNIVVKSNNIYKYYNITYDYEADQFPSFLEAKIKDLTFYSAPPIVRIYITTPNGFRIPVYTLVAENPQKGMSPPYIYYTNYTRIFISGDPNVARELVRYLYLEYNITLSSKDAMDIGYEHIIFGMPHVANDTLTFTPNKGTYVISFELQADNINDKIDESVFVVGGKTYGFMGTDLLGRDLAQGLLFGFPVALLIGVLTSLLTTVIGSFFGIVSGYKGGLTDEAIQRTCDVMNNIPTLPLFILILFIVGTNPHIWKLGVIMLLLIVFGWPGLTILLRSMVLPLRESEFVESAKAIGASSWRIMFRHIFSYVAPYILAQMIFFTPSAILTEAALSFLGLGDPTIPTWGQILEYGFRNGAIYQGYWWWILPPGLLIVYTAMVFVLIALGLEPVVNPRLRRRR